MYYKNKNIFIVNNHDITFLEVINSRISAFSVINPSNNADLEIISSSLRINKNAQIYIFINFSEDKFEREVFTDIKNINVDILAKQKLIHSDNIDMFSGYKFIGQKSEQHYEYVYVSSPYKKILENLIEFICQYSNNILGVYSLKMQGSNIKDLIAQEFLDLPISQECYQKSYAYNHCTIMVVQEKKDLLQIYAIKNNDVIHCNFVNLVDNNSFDFLVGSIKYNIDETINLLKKNGTYSELLDVIIFCHEEIEKNLFNIAINCSDFIVVTPQKIVKKLDILCDKIEFTDNVKAILCYLLVLKKPLIPLYNQSISKIINLQNFDRTLNVVNKICFLFFIVFLLVSQTAEVVNFNNIEKNHKRIKTENHQYEKLTSYFSKLNYKIDEKYNYPLITHILSNNLNPFYYLQVFQNTPVNDVYTTMFEWKLIDNLENFHIPQRMSMIINTEHDNKKQGFTNELIEFKSYMKLINKMRSLLPQYTIETTHSPDEIKFFERKPIYGTINILGPNIPGISYDK